MTDTRVPALLFDGGCGLCNGVVRFLARHDPAARLRFGALQGPAAQRYLVAQGLPTDDFESLVFVPDWNDPRPGAYLLRTSGALACFAEIRGPWRAVAWLRAIPAFLRDPFYRLVARTRYALFGAYVPRPSPDPSWSKRFLDT
jgi:predicted DCC family thiol-disulfide oxidoreductase YuxK